MICMILITVWRRQTNKIVNSGLKKCAAACIGVMCLIGSSLCGYFISRQLLDMFLQGDGRALCILLISELVTTSIITFLFYVLLSILTPEEVTVVMLLQYFPLKEYEKVLGYYAPQIGCVTILSTLFMYCLYLPAMFVNRIPFITILNFMCCIIAQSFLCVLMMVSIEKILICLLKKAGIPYHKSLKSIGSTMLVVVYMVNYMREFQDILKHYDSFRYRFVHIMYGFFGASDAVIRLKVNHIFLFLYIFGIMIFFCICINLKTGLENSKSLMLFKRMRFSSNKGINLVIKELKIMYRNEENVLMYVCVALCLVILRIKTGITAEYKMLPLMLGGICGFWALSAFGSDRYMIGLYKNLGVTKRIYIFGKVIGNIIGGNIVYIIFIAILYSIHIDIMAVIKGEATLILSSVFLFCLGVLFPQDKESPYNQGIISILCIIMAIPVWFIAGQLRKMGIMYPTVALFSVICVLAAGTYTRISEAWSGLYDE